MKTVDKLDALLNGQPETPLRPHQVESLTEEKERLEKIVNAPAWNGGDRGVAARRMSQITKMLESQSPKLIKGTLASEVYQAAQQVLTDDIRPAMLTREEMRRNPAGAVGTFIRQENSKPVQRAINTWKRAMFALDPTTEDPDHANIERFRPEKALEGSASTFMAGAQIPGHFAMSPQAKANWPTNMPPEGTVDSPQKQAKRRELSPEQRKAIGERLASARNAKRTAS